MKEFLDQVLSITEAISGSIWWPFTIVLLFGTGIILSFRTKFVQVRLLGRGFKEIFISDSTDTHGISPFQALMTSLAATVGNGNIAGVSTAIMAGGPGAIFWMWLSAFFGMSTKYSEGLLGRKFRVLGHDGEYTGGPMYYLEKVMNPKIGRFLALWFAIAIILVGLIGSGNMAQSNSIALAFKTTFNASYMITGIVLALLVFFVLSGGLKRIASLTDKLVPFMIGFYLLAGLIVVIINFEQIPHVFMTIIKSAFKMESVAGGVIGHTIKEALRFGVSRGVLSNESGTGSCAIPAAVAQSKDNASQGLVAMMGTFIDTIIVCSITSFVIISSNEYIDSNVTSVALTNNAFSSALGDAIGTFCVNFSSIIFGFSTLIAYSYFVEQGVRYLFPNSTMRTFRATFCVFTFLGAVLQGEYLNIVWNLSDIANALMVIPNVIGLIYFSKVIAKETQEYTSQHDS